MKDYYKILELKFGVREEDIKKAYRVLAQKYHPDKHFGNKKYDEFFKEINEAYSVLSDPLKKSSYDIRYKDYFFRQSSTNGNSANSSTNNNTNENSKKEQGNGNTKKDNQQSNSMNKDALTKNDKFYNNKAFRYGFLLFIVGIVFLIYEWKNISNYYDEKDKKENYERLVSSIQEAKKFNESAIAALKIPKITLETRWKDDLMYYKFYLLNKGKEKDNSYVRLLDDSLKTDLYFETRVKTMDKITVNFLDKDGFKIYILNIPINGMTRIVDGDGNVIGYTINSNITMKPELYKDFQSWELTYTTK